MPQALLQLSSMYVGLLLHSFFSAHSPHFSCSSEHGSAKNSESLGKSESPQTSQDLLHFTFIYIGLVTHSFSDAQNSHFVLEHSPDSEVSWHASFSSIQKIVSGKNVAKSSEVELPSPVSENVGLRVLLSSNISSNILSVWLLDISNAVGGNESNSDGLIVNDGDIVGSMLPLSTGRFV